uniref:Uncharacterized protein n=1 Tax=Rhabditophanes sp. KR3021 TaxID=114890 RepID=A0AC35TVM9_9BILA
MKILSTFLFVVFMELGQCGRMGNMFGNEEDNDMFPSEYHPNLSHRKKVITKTIVHHKSIGNGLENEMFGPIHEEPKIISRDDMHVDDLDGMAEGTGGNRFDLSDDNVGYGRHIPLHGESQPNEDEVFYASDFEPKEVEDNSFDAQPYHRSLDQRMENLARMRKQGRRTMANEAEFDKF